MKVGFALEEAVARILLDDGKTNSCEPSFVRELSSALDRAEQSMARAVLVEGRSGIFSSGIDLKVLPSLDATARRAFLRDYGRLVLRLYLFPRPVVAAVTGHAVAGGVVLALACDLRVAAAGPFKLGFREVTAGMALPGFALEIARTQIPGPARTRLLGFGELVGPDEARSLGMVDRVVERKDVRREAMREAFRLASLPEPAYAMTKRGLRSPTVAAALAHEEADVDALLHESSTAFEGAPPLPVYEEAEPPRGGTRGGA